ncbi:ribose-phosphate diphosphokinase [Candidatus Saccharibacteria bacterium]|nr:ribose-phosphate diphosphokinase [Candidatus Saccharibacteria bacterium]
MHQIKLIATPSSLELAQNVNQYLNKLFHSKNQNYIADTEFIRFNNGEGKCIAKENLSGYDVYILCDPDNYGSHYDLVNTKHYMSPDEHIQDLKRAISALGGQAARINVVMPMLYQSRQDKRKTTESLDCAMMLKELEWYGVKNLITIDVHNASVENAIPFGMSFHNHTAIDKLLKEFTSTRKWDKLFVVSPDIGASKRADYSAKALNVTESGFFEKRRNYNILKDGQNPIEYHEFNGPESLSGYDILLVDDMIASGNSLLSSMKLLKKLGANKIYLMTTFSIFTNGLERFIDAKNQALFETLFTTNLSYIPPAYQEYDFIHIVDCSPEIANSIFNLNQTF